MGMQTRIVSICACSLCECLLASSPRRISLLVAFKIQYIGKGCSDGNYAGKGSARDCCA
jgi:hypothetical protein